MQKIFVTSSIAIVLLFAGCSSSAKRGSKALEKGDFDSALGYLDDAVAKKPKNADLITKRQEARAGWLGNRLLEARAARVGGDLDRAFETLLTVFTKSKEWGTSARGAAAFTSEEETELSWLELKKRLQTWQEQGYPIKAFYYLKRYAPIFSTKKMEFESYRKGATLNSQKLCKKFATDKDVGDGFYAGWLNKTCSVFGLKTNLNASGMKKSLFGKINLELDVDSMPATSRTKLRTDIEKGFSASPWFIEGGERVLKSEGVVEFIQKTESESFFMTHEYTEKVEGQADPVKREYRYPAVRNRQYFWISLKLKGESDGFFFFKETDRDEAKKEGISHQEEKWAWDIHPQSFVPMDATAWVNERVDRILAKISSAYLSNWRSMMCTNSLEISVSEQSVRCLYGVKEDIPASAKEWLQSKTGLSPQQYADL